MRDSECIKGPCTGPIAMTVHFSLALQGRKGVNMRTGEVKTK